MEGTPPAATEASSVVPVAVAVAVCAFSTLALFYHFVHRKPKDELIENSEEEDNVCRGDIPQSEMPADGVFTMKTLARFDGRQLPMCLAICGKVVNVSSSENFTPDHGYGKLWAGSETTYSMAKVSLKPEDANKMDWNLNELSDQERDTLAGWYKHFTTKYPIIGTLKESDGWDFSTIEQEAKSKTPFGASKTEDLGEVAADAATTEPPPPPPAPKQEGLMIRKGGRYLLKNMPEERSEFEGKVAVLQDLDKAVGMFLVIIEGKEDPVHVMPSQLAELPAGQ